MRHDASRQQVPKERVVGFARTSGRGRVQMRPLTDPALIATAYNAAGARARAAAPSRSTRGAVMQAWANRGPRESDSRPAAGALRVRARVRETPRITGAHVRARRRIKQCVYALYDTIIP